MVPYHISLSDMMKSFIYYLYLLHFIRSFFHLNNVDNIQKIPTKKSICSSLFVVYTSLSLNSASFYFFVFTFHGASSCRVVSSSIVP